MQLSQRFSRDNDVHSLLLMSQLVVSAQLHEKLDQANAEIEQLNSELQRDNRILNPINRNTPYPLDQKIYRRRNVIERMFCKLACPRRRGAE
jgi:TolA-binding protein